MKTNSLIIAAFLMISSLVSFAGNDEPRKTGLAVVPVKGSEVFRVIYKGETTGKVKLNIYNASGSVVFTETLAGLDGFIYPVNFKGLASGEYTIELVDASGKRSEKVNYAPVKNVNKVRVTKLASHESKFLVSVANSGEEVINVKIYDNALRLIYTESKEIAGDKAWVYRITEPGSYTFEVTDRAGNSRLVKF